MDGARLVGWLPLIPLFPLLGFALNAFFGKKGGQRFVAFVGVGAPLAGFMLAIAAFLGLLVHDQITVVDTTGRPRDQIRQLLVTGANPIPVSPDTVEDKAEHLLRVPRPLDEVRDAMARSAPGVKVARSGDVHPRSFFGPAWSDDRHQKHDIPWISVGGFTVSFRFVFDRLSGLLCLVVLGVGSLIHIYSLAYMSTEDRGGYARYFAYLNLFTGMMLVLALAGDLMLLFVGWEGVGLASYLLIGFEYREGWKAEAGIKAFVVNRIGDLGFMLGALALATTAIAVGGSDLRLDHVNAMALAGKIAPATLGLIALCLFLGATGKSAQIPLYVWLPDAMAGPTPVSALIHAATMVTAGVYMLARLHPVFEMASVGGIPVLGIVAAIGVLTAFVAATSALAQDDVKKVLAYSTVSQLGYMFVGAGVGAFSASIFHLVTHAFFKALLFLGAGSLIHATGTQELKKMGGLRKVLPTTYWTMMVGAACLAGLPGLSGFFSKDMILGSALEKALESHHPAWFIVYGVGVLGGFITAFYSTRLVAMAFFGKEGETAKHAHESPPLMTTPLVLLAVLSVLGGLLGLPALLGEVGSILPHWLAPIVQAAAPVAEHGAEAAAHHEGAGAEVAAIVISTIAALAGVALGWTNYGSGDLPAPIAEAEKGTGAFGRPRQFLANAWHIDATYTRFIAQPIMGVARRLWSVADDAFLDRGVIDGAGRLARGLGELVASLQTGRVARYAAYVAVGAVALLLAQTL